MRTYVCTFVRMYMCARVIKHHYMKAEMALFLLINCKMHNQFNVLKKNSCLFPWLFFFRGLSGVKYYLIWPNIHGYVCAGHSK